ncbi:MAG: hypothetical protein H0W09_01665, partial [Solirubrobacterales bacterium]|nr:hypothetical protein [Solirubrobacterales bacterium]
MALETAFSFIQSSFTLPLAQAEPAGGAAIDQIVIATLGASLIFGALSWLCLRHRAGKTDVLRRASARVGGFTGLPGWAALPIALAGVSLVTALLGMYWDISLHIDVGRDAGPLANPAHYLILAGLFGVLAAGMLAIFLPEQRPGPASIRLAGEWHAPIGGITLTACGAFSLIGFPLDDIWHRLFGQDVTLWGPTHLMLIGGAAMTIVGMSLLLVEGMRFRDSNRSRPLEPRVRRRSDFLVVSRRIGLAGALLIGLSTFQAEWDFGVPQFPMELEPLLLALAASMALVCARIWIGPGGAFAAAGFYILARGLTSVMVGPVLGETLPHMPIYLAEAVLVELTALAIIRLGAGRLHPIRFGLASGLLIGTVGFAAEWGWSHLWMPIPWTTDLLPTAPILALAAALAGGVAGALL